MPIFTLAGTAVAGALFGGSSIAALLISGGLAYGASLLVSYINRPAEVRNTAVQGQVQYGARVAATTLFGEGKTKGHHIFYAKYGSGNQFNADVFVLANGWCDGLEPEVYFDGQKHGLVARPIIGNEAAHYGVADFGDLVSIRFYDGRPGQGVDTKLVADTANLGKTWKATSRCTGLTYVVLERRYDADKFKGRSDFDFVLRGLREYDPRLDSTVPGGSGPQRLDNPATWVHSLNPAVHRLNYQLGLRGRVSGRTLIGEGKSLGQLDLGSYIAAMNACDALRNGKPTYQASLFVSGEDDHTNVLKDFDDAMAGYALNRRGLSGVIAGAPQIPVATITAADIPVGRAQDIKRRKSAFELFNHMSGQFISREAQWQPESLKPVYVNADVARDGRPRQTATDFLQVTDPDIAQYLLSIRYRQNRKGGSATVPVSRRLGFRVQEGEWVSFEGKSWLITGWRCDDQLRVALTLAETGADVYASAGIEPGPIIVPPTPAINPSLLSTVQNFDVAVGFITGDGGKEAPALRFDWAPPDDPSIIAVRFFYFVGTDPTGQTVYEDQSTDVEAGTYTTTKNVAPGVRYTARATITTVPDRLKTYTLWRTTADATGPFNFADLDAITEEVEARVGELSEWATTNTRETIERLRSSMLETTLASANAYTDRQRIRQSVLSVTGKNRAEWMQDILVATGPDSAIALRVEELRSQVFDPDTGLPATTEAVNLLSTEVNDPGTGLQAVGNAILSITSSVPGQSAEGLFRIFTAATATGEDVRIALSAAASGAAGPANAALYLTAGGGNSELLLVANRISAITSPGGTKRGLLVIDGDNVYMDNARIRELTAGNVATRSLTADVLAANTLTSAEINVVQLLASNAFVTNLRVRSANIDDLQVGRIKIANGAVTDFPQAGNYTPETVTGQVIRSSPAFVTPDGPFIAAANMAGFGGEGVNFIFNFVRLVRVSDGAAIILSAPGNQSNSLSLNWAGVVWQHAYGQQYRLEVATDARGSGGSTSFALTGWACMAAIPRK